MSFDKWGPLTVLIVALVLVGAAAGAVVVVAHPSTLNFDAYLSDVSKFVIGLGLLGIGHGAAKIAAPAAAAPVEPEAEVEEPGDPDALPHFPAKNPDKIPADQGDAGQEGSA